ncbi:MAG TPA: hypothetical protein VFR37_07275 [Longimicrobium sp.]|nr:hypothetical protein [Longimicrobium sp.]
MAIEAPVIRPRRFLVPWTSRSRWLALVAAVLASSCKNEHRASTADGAMNTVNENPAVEQVASAPEPPSSARINECRRARFYELLSDVADFYAGMYQQQPTKDQYETNNEYWRRLQQWMASGERSRGNPAPPILYYLRIPVERAHYDADRELLVFDSIAEVRIPAVTVGTPSVTFMAFSCSAVPFFACRGFNYWNRMYDVAPTAYGMRMQVLPTAALPVPRAEARAQQLLDRQLALDVYWSSHEKEIRPQPYGVSTMRVRHPDLPIFAPQMRLEAVRLLVAGEPSQFFWINRTSGATEDPQDPDVYAPVLNLFARRPRGIDAACRALLQSVPDTVDAIPDYSVFNQ